MERTYEEQIIQHLTEAIQLMEQISGGTNHLYYTLARDARWNMAFTHGLPEVLYLEEYLNGVEEDDG